MWPLKKPMARHSADSMSVLGVPGPSGGCQGVPAQCTVHLAGRHATGSRWPSLTPGTRQVPHRTGTQILLAELPRHCPSRTNGETEWGRPPQWLGSITTYLLLEMAGDNLE
jgi:hypothetical protein